jgi:hypothetical protein
MRAADLYRPTNMFFYYVTIYISQLVHHAHLRTGIIKVIFPSLIIVLGRTKTDIIIFQHPVALVY